LDVLIPLHREPGRDFRSYPSAVSTSSLDHQPKSTCTGREDGQRTISTSFQTRSGETHHMAPPRRPMATTTTRLSTNASAVDALEAQLFDTGSADFGLPRSAPVLGHPSGRFYGRHRCRPRATPLIPHQAPHHTSPCSTHHRAAHRSATGGVRYRHSRKPKRFFTGNRRPARQARAWFCWIVLHLLM
jgi:hypothetical protein